MPSTPFIGRGALLADLGARLASEAALITLVGAPGIGKSRLAREALRAGDDASLVCDLAGTRDAASFFAKLARALRLETDADPSAAVVAAIRRRRPVVLLDGMDAFAGRAESTVDVLLDEAPEVLFMVTSRERLHVRGEEVVLVEPLARDEAVDLFQASATGSSDPKAVAALVEHLDRNPLAIELAAARTRTLSAAQLVERLEQRFALLRSRSASLHDAIELSWELLTAGERDALIQASVFVGGFELEAAEAVVKLLDVFVFDVLDSLVEKSLLSVSAEHRFRMGESIRAFVVEQAAPASDQAERRHAAYFAGLNERWSSVAWSSASLDAAAMEVPNLLAAARRSREHSAETALEAILGASSVLRHRGQTAVHLGVLEDGLAIATGAVRARLLVRRSELLSVTGRLGDARSDAEEAVALASGTLATHARTLVAELDRRLGESGRSVESLRKVAGEAEPAWHRFVDAHLAAALCDVGDLEAARELVSAVDAPNAGFPPHLEGLALKRLAYVHYYLGNYEQQRRLNEEALAIADALGDRRRVARARQGLGDAAFARGDYQEARRTYQDALEEHRELGNEHLTGVLLGNLGTVEHRLNDLDSAALRYVEALALHRQAGVKPYEAVVSYSLGTLEHERGNFADAAFHYRRSVELSRELGQLDDVVATTISWAWLEFCRDDRAAASERLGTVAAQGEWSEVIALTTALINGTEASATEPSSGGLPLLIARALRELLTTGEVTSSDELSRSLQGRLVPLLGRRCQVVSGPAAARVTIAADGTWFRVGAEEVSLRRRKAHRRILAELAGRWPNGQPLGVYEAFDLGWPGEGEVEPEVAAERVYWVVGVLRRLGLDGVLLTLDDGYILARDEQLEIQNS